MLGNVSRQSRRFSCALSGVYPQHCVPAQANRLHHRLFSVLQVVGTPIGHPDDLSIRALRALSQARLIAAEDTRKTASLLRHHAVPLAGKQLLSFNSVNWAQRMPLLMAALTAGHNTALVSDAGMPGVNDPGQELVAAATAAGVPTTCIPGPSAYTTAVALSGLPAAAQGGWLAGGWVPRPGAAARAAWLRLVASPTADAPGSANTLVFLEGPSRITRTICDVRDACTAAGVTRPLVLCRELTKRHEEVTRGTPAQVAAAMQGGHAHSDKGEFTLVLGPCTVVKL